MDDLLKYYEAELAILNAHNQEFAERYPLIAGRLGMENPHQRDPHVDRIIQACAMFNARTAKRLDDSFKEFTETLLEVNFPHYLRPFPSCSIAQVDNSGRHGNKIDFAAVIPRGTVMNAHEQEGVICRFRTAYDVAVAPVRVAAARFEPLLDLPPALRQPRAPASALAIRLETTVSSAALDQLGAKVLRVYIDGPRSFRACLRDALFIDVSSAWLETDSGWHALEQVPVAAVGFGADDALIPFKATSHPAYRLLTEYFCFPDKFNFFDIDLPGLAPLLPAACQHFTLHLGLTDVHADSAKAGMLRLLSHKHLLLGCTPVVNLFPQSATPISLTHATADYPLVAENRDAHAYDIHSVDSVRAVRASGAGVDEFHPYYSLRHGDAGGRQGRYWLTRRDETMARTNPGYDTRIALVDIDFNPLREGMRTVSVELTCSNRDYPTRLPCGAPNGDLRHNGPAAEVPVRLLRKPDPPLRFKADDSARWRLISQLSLNHQSLIQDGLPILKEMLTLYDLPASAAAQRQIDGITGLDHRAGSAWMNSGDDTNGGGLVYGIDVQLTVDEEAYVGSGLHVFAQMLERVLGLYVHFNSYTRLIVVSRQSGKELIRCLPVNGSQTLL